MSSGHGRWSSWNRLPRRRRLHHRAALAAQAEAAFDERLASRSQELAELTENRQRLQNESDKILAANFADAIDLETLKRHQDRIRTGLADIDRRLASEHDHHTGARKRLSTALGLLVDCTTLYARTGDPGKRLANQALTDGIEISEDERATIRLAEPFAALTQEPPSTDVRSSSTSSIVDRGGLQPREWKRVERLGAVWDLAKRGLGPSGSAADSGLAGAVTEPTRRTRTPLTPHQIDAIHTARDSGESVVSIARRFEVSRVTVREKTRHASS